MTLYYVQDDGVSLTPGEMDLFVRARSVQGAIELWRKYYEMRCNPQKIRALPTYPRLGAINWDLIPIVYKRRGA